MAPWHDPGAIARACDVLGGIGRIDAPLGDRTTYRVGGAAAVLVEVDDLGQLELVAEARERSGLPVLTVGKGSNLLVADRGFEGIVVCLSSRFEQFETHGDLVVAGGALSLPVLARRSVAAARAGLEWAVGVPGSVGGAVRMNAGGHGSDVAASLVDAQVFDLDQRSVEVWERDAFHFGYRTSQVGAQHVVVGARFRTAAGDVEAGEQLLAEIVQWRRAHQPGGHNAGSVFVNPPGTSAGAEIDRLGLKGRRLGTAEVSSKHANFIQADDGGRAQDVADLIDDVASTVESSTGVRLHTEIRRVGFDRGSDA